MPQGAFSPQTPPLLDVRGLGVDLIASSGAPLSVLSGISFQTASGSITGLFGESGCGKTTMALALPKLLAPGRYRVRGTVHLAGRDLLAAPERELERIRGAEVAFIFQDPLLSLNPVMRVRHQVGEVMRAHGPPAGAGEAESVLQLAGLQPSRRILDAYPHQLSGGERQRVAIAQALACRPSLVIADEPFSALDAALALDLAGLFRELAGRLGTAFLLISHSPGVLARIADQVLVMYAGRLVERGTARQVLREPLHPYTAALLGSMPRFDGAGKRLSTIPGDPPGIEGRGRGCPFEPRCGARLDFCAAAMPAESGRVRCFQYGS